MSLTACLLGGPEDGSLVILPKPMLEFRVAKPAARLHRIDLEDMTDDPFVTVRHGSYRRGREGIDVTFYEWTGWN